MSFARGKVIAGLLLSTVSVQIGRCHQTTLLPSTRGDLISLGDPVIQTLFLGEAIEATSLDYTAFDVVNARRAEIFDFNSEGLVKSAHGKFNAVLNLGTTEHILNQFNSFNVIHDACKVGGHIFHQVPSTGYINHCYFTYNAMFFRDLAEANDYEIVDLWYWDYGSGTKVDVDDYRLPWPEEPPRASPDVPDLLISVLFRKRQDLPFRSSLEVRTAAGELTTSARSSLATPINTHATETQEVKVQAHNNEVNSIDYETNSVDHLIQEADRDINDNNFKEATVPLAKATQLIHGYGPATERMRHLAQRFIEDANRHAKQGNSKGEQAAIVKAIEMDPSLEDCRKRLADLLQGGQDLTRQCMVHIDPKRGETMYRDTIQRALDYVAANGIVGDILEFGTLGGFTARLFCETMARHAYDSRHSSLRFF